MFPKGTPDPEYPSNANHSGIRLDGRNLVQEWQAKYQVMGAPGCRGYSRGRGRGCKSQGNGLKPGSVPRRVPSTCGTALHSFGHPRTPL